MVQYWSSVVKIIPYPVIPAWSFKKEKYSKWEREIEEESEQGLVSFSWHEQGGWSIGRTVFIAPTREPLIPVKSPEKQPKLTASRRSVEAGKLQDMNILNHVPLTNKILIWAFPPTPNSIFATGKGVYLRHSSLVGGLMSVRNTSHIMHGKISPGAQSVLSPPQPMGTGAARTEVLRAL